MMGVLKWLCPESYFISELARHIKMNNELKAEIAMLKNQRADFLDAIEKIWSGIPR